MPEILTESFCERCGTRYTFESAAPRKTRRLGQIKTLSKGMKNWVMSDDTSLDEAMAAARNDDDRELTSHQLDAFHATFNFCMTCRQYTCGNCWNTAEGRCLTCAPHLGHEILPAPFPDQAASEPVRIEAQAWPEVDLSVPGVAAAEGNGNGHENGFHPDQLDPWASAGAIDGEAIAEIDPAARLAFLSGESPAPIVAAETRTFVEGVDATETGVPSGWPAADEPVADIASDPFAAAETAPAPAAREVVEPLPPTVGGKADAGVARTADLLRRFRPGQNIDAELAAYEAERDDSAGGEPAAAAAADSLIAAQPGTVLDDPPAGIAASAVLAASEQPIEAASELAVADAHVETAEPEPVAAEPEPAELIGAETAQPVAAEEPVAREVVTPAPRPDLTWRTPATPAPATPAPAPAEPTSPTPEPVAAEPPRDDRIEQPTWQIFAPDATPAVGRPNDGAVPPPALPVPSPAATGDPQWPVHPDQAESPAMALLANRANRSPSDGLWAASAQEVLARPASAPAAVAGVQPCSSCGLSLSSTARFCRRCGTRQG